jgi:hypothetical protein
MARKKRVVESVHGWRDTPPDLTTGEHDLMVATLQKAWADVQIDPESVPPPRREEAVAVKVTAYEWITWSDALYRSLGLEAPRVSFSTVCLHLDLNPESVRAVLLRGVTPPEVRVPDRWREFFYGRKTRLDRGWKHRNNRTECPQLDDVKPDTEHSLDTLRRAVVHATLPVTAHEDESEPR